MLVFDNEQKRTVVIDVLIPVDTNIRQRKHWKEPRSPGNNWSRCRRWNPKSRCKNLSSLSNRVQSYQQLRYYAETSNYSRQRKLYPLALYKLINGWQSATVFLFSTNQMKRKRPVSPVYQHRWNTDSYFNTNIQFCLTVYMFSQNSCVLSFQETLLKLEHLQQ